MTDRIPSAHDVYGFRRPSLNSFFKPQTVAVIGGTEREGSIGRTLMHNLVSGSFGGTIFPVNPSHKQVMGLTAYAAIADVPKAVNLALIALPAAQVLAAVRQCVAAEVKAAIIISAGFRETGEAGAALEAEILAEARRGRMRLIGPNSLGVMNPHTGLNASFANGMAQPGSVAFVSQSGALGTAVLDWSLRENLGFSAFVSAGSMLDVNWGDLIDYLGSDARTKSIVIYMETLGDARAFMSAARAAALNKPIIVIKPGRTAAAAKVVATHTGVLTGEDAVVDAALRRCGVLRVHSLASLFYMAEILGKQPRPRGPRLAVVTNAGGPAVLTTDALIANGGALAELSEATIAEVGAMLPDHWSRGNPIDLLGEATPEQYATAVELAGKDAGSDGLLVILAPQAWTDPTAVAEALSGFGRGVGKPVLASWMGGARVEAGIKLLNDANIPTFEYPDTAARMFTHMWRYSDNLRALYETPQLPVDTEEDIAAHSYASDMIEFVRGRGRTLLTEYESKIVLVAYNIPIVDTRLVENAAEAVTAARAIGYPVVVKLNSETLTHKSDVGGVVLNVRNDTQVELAFQAIRDAVVKKFSAADFKGVTVQPMVDLADGYELIVGSSPDNQFGPVLLFGAGGTLVEVVGDRALGLPPLNSTLARRLMEQTQIFGALKGIRGRAAVNLEELDSLLVRFSQLVVEQSWIKEIEINPLFVTGGKIQALDARVVLYESEAARGARPKLAIRPYPKEYVAAWTMRDGREVTIRPIRPEDEPLLVKFHENLSEQSVYNRYFQSLDFDRRTAHERLVRISLNDFDREIALVVERNDPETNEATIIAVARLTLDPTHGEAEFAALVDDRFHGQGLGTEMLRRLIEIGRKEGVPKIVAYTLPSNAGMKGVFKKLGFKMFLEDGVTKAQLMLEQAE